MKGKRTNKPDLKSKSIGFDDISAFINKGWDKGKKALIEKRLSNSKQIALGALLAGATGNVLGRSIPVSHKNVDKKDSFLSKHAPNIMMSAGAAGMLANAFRDSKMNPLKRVIKDFKGGNPQTKALAALAGAGLGFRLGRVHALADMDAPYKEKRSYDKVAFVNQLKSMFMSAPPAQKKGIIRSLLSKAPHMLAVLGLTAAGAAAMLGTGAVAGRRNAITGALSKQLSKSQNAANFANLKGPQKAHLAKNQKLFNQMNQDFLTDAARPNIINNLQNNLGAARNINPLSGANITQGFQRLTHNPAGFFGGIGQMAGRGIMNTYRALGGGPALARSILL